MKQWFFTGLILFCFLCSNAQNNYYYAGNGINYWQEDSTSVNIIVSDIDNLSYIAQNIQNIFSASSDTVSYVPDDDNIIVISDKLKKMPLTQLTANICQDPADIAFITYAKRINQKRIWLRNELYVKLKHDTLYFSYLHPFLSDFTDWVLQYDSIEKDYKIICVNETQLLQIANGLYDTTFVIYSTPDFYSEASLQTTDPNFDEQWALKNTGQQNGVPSVDIKAEKAWTFLQYYYNKLGDSIRVAVIDDGVESHEDLKGATGQSRVLLGFPAYGQGGPYNSQQWHGQACAGIIASSHNNKGGAGVAPNTLIVPIRIVREANILFNNARIRNGIRKSWQEFHAQVLSNSWGTDRIHHSLIDKAFNDAVEYGREGNGCIVVVASGNCNYSQVEYPADLPDVIAVGATDRCGIRAGTHYITNSCDEWDQGASSFGSKLSVVAPGSHVFTIDRMGILGADTGNYISAFGGTSAACPHVAGLAALILSVNPELTHSQVKEIIEKTAQKIGGYNYSNTNGHSNGTWNEEMGYGMVNAFLAVAEAKIYGTEYSISGPLALQLCNEYTYTLSGNVPEGYEIIWETNPHMAIVSGQGTSTVVVRPIYQATGNWVKVRICFDGETIREKQLNPILSTGIGYQLVVPQDFAITQNLLWDIERSLAHTVTIEADAVLTITTTIHCTDHAKIIVNPGGKLIVDGGTLTSACFGEMWQGIFVEGHSNLHQTEANQGKVVLRNGAVIENAICGIRTSAPDDSTITTGGIIKAFDATFHNNRRAVAFFPYADIVSGTTVRDNFSGFSNCTFTVDNDNLFAANNTSFDAHATLWDVKGVSFEGCTFTNATTAMTFDKGYAIKSIDAGFRVATLCDNVYPEPNTDCRCPENQATYSQFSGFQTAISASTSGNTYYVLVDEAQFSNNGTGIYISGNNHVTVTRNDFDMNSLPGTIIEGTGLSLNSCSGYLVEENSFHRTSLSGPFPFEGICVTNSGSAANLLYRNDFSRLNKAVTVVGTNRGTKNPVGLECKCNSFYGIQYDIYVSANSSMSPQQGSSSAGADNQFSGTTVSSLYNAGSYAITYYNSGTGIGLVPYNPTFNVTVWSNAAANPCQSTLCGSGNVLPPPGPIKSPDAGYLALKAQYDTLLSEFESRGYADIVADPSEDLHSQADILSARLAFAQLGELERELHTRSNNAVRALLRDTLLDLPALESWFAATPGLSSRYSLAETEYLSGASNALTLQGVSALLETEEERDEYDNYMAFNALKEALSGYLYGHADWPSATGTQIAELQRIADANTGRSSVMARGVLCFFFGICEDEDFTVMGDPRHLAATGANDISSHHQDVSMKLYPNPVTNTLHVEFEGLDDPQGTIAVADITGVVVQHVETSQRGVTIDVSHLTPGLYVVSFRNKNGVAVRKFVKM